MKLKRAIGISVLTYIVSFIIGLIITFVMWTDISGVESIPLTHRIFAILFSIIVTAIFTLWYFKGKNIKASAKEGLYFGIILMIVGTLLDAIIAVPYAIMNNVSALLKYYLDPLFYISLILILLTTVIIGKIKEKK